MKKKWKVINLQNGKTEREIERGKRTKKMTNTNGGHMFYMCDLQSKKKMVGELPKFWFSFELKIAEHQFRAPLSLNYPATEF